MKQVEQLTDWVRQKHLGQQIKKTGEPYFTHLAAVANMAGQYTLLGYEIGLCHDLLEDTDTTLAELHVALTSFNYSPAEASYIAAAVIELTDVFTATAYPGLSKKARKEKEALRLQAVSAGAQTVKYCDLVDNITWVLEHDQRHAIEYLEKKKLLLAGMTNGNKKMLQKALNAVNNGLSGNS